MELVLVVFGSALAIGLLASLFLFLDAYFFGGGLETSGIPLRKKWSKTWRMKRFLGLDE